jgi:Spy/CpxP family protein refolding chaperone
MCWELRSGGMMKIFLFVLSILVTISFGQESEPQDPRAIIEKVRIYRLTRELDLTTEQAVELFPKLNELQKIDKEFRVQEQEIIDNLRGLLDSDALDKEILKSLGRYEDIFRERLERQINKMKEIRKVLTPNQQARYIIFQDEFEHEIREMIREVKKLRPR